MIYGVWVLLVATGIGTGMSRTHFNEEVVELAKSYV